MATNNNNKALNVPHLRFPEFTGEWKEYMLSDFVERVKRKNKNNLCKLPLTISAQYGLVDQISFFNKVIASENMSNYYLLHKGDFAYNGKTLKFAIKATKVEVGNTTLDKFPITTFNFDMSKK